MRYHNITHDDMLNGEGIRVVLWVSGCIHNCKNCHNKETHDINGGILFDEKAKNEIFEELKKDYVDGITLSGGDPLHPKNREDIFKLITEIKEKFKDKSIWLYTGYKFEEIWNIPLISCLDIVVDGKFNESLKSTKYHWAGSTNQRVIDVKETLKKGKIKNYEDY